MKSFDHVDVKSVREAVRLLDSHHGGAALIAGGTDLLAVLKDRILVSYPKTMINIKTIPRMETIEEKSGGLRIGALSRLSAVAESPLVLEDFRALAEAAKSVATPQIRNMGTIGGNLCQDVRCWYYRYPHHLGGRMICRRKGKGPCFAVKGDNRYNAILGAKSCFAVCPSDIAVSLTALGAKARLAAPSGNRWIPVSDLYTPQGMVLDSNELLTEIIIPGTSRGTVQSFLKFTQRGPVDFAVASVASVITLRDGICVDAKIVLGGVAPFPFRSEKAELVLKGKPISKETAEIASEKAVSGAKPLSKNGYKIEIARALVKKSILSRFQAA